MQTSLEINQNKYIPAKVAAKLVGYTGDYVGRLAREKKIIAAKVKGQWFVEEDSLRAFSKLSESEKAKRQERLRTERKEEQRRERFVEKKNILEKEIEEKIMAGRSRAAIATLAIACVGILSGVGGHFGSSLVQSGSFSIDNVNVLAASIYNHTVALGDLGAARQSALTPRAETEEVRDTRSFDDKAKITSRGEQGAANSGIVLFEDDTRQETVDAVRNSFSDEVIVDVDENNPDTGFVRPVFREREGEAYRFLLVPVVTEPPD